MTTRSQHILTIRCSKCKTKLFKYLKIGKGQVIKCHKDRIQRIYNMEQKINHYICPCGNLIGSDEGSFIKMNANAFMYTGTKDHK